MRVLGITSGVGSLQYGFKQEGFDDDFVFYPLQYEYGSKEHLSLIKQTGKCMPIQFPREFARQLKNFINNGILEETENRLLKQI
jgi:hypothetical protein